MTKIRLAAVALICALAAFSAPASAEPPDDCVLPHDQTPPAPDVGELGQAPVADDATVLALGQVFVSEVNWAKTPDPAAIAEVLRGRQLARGDATMLDTIRAYSPRATGVEPSGLIRMRWISTLRLDAGEPSGWALLNLRRLGRGDHALPWSRYEERWRAIASSSPASCSRGLHGAPATSPLNTGAQHADRTSKPQGDGAGVCSTAVTR